MSTQESKRASVRSLLKLSIPLMLTWISTTIMMFVDRLFLSFYSLDALGAAINAGTIAWGFAYGFQLFTENAQVIVAQYKGAKKESRMIEPVWQMLWLTLLSLVFFLPLAFWGTHIFFSQGSLQSIYFRCLVIFGPAFGLIGAGSAYFIGKGETKTVTVFAAIGNVVNLILDWILIFGIEGVIPSYGVKGAAIATGLGMLVQGLGLVFLFLKRTNFVTFSLSWIAFKPCIRACLPTALYICTELVGWGLFYTIMAKTSSKHILVTGICQCLIPLLAFVGIGLQKAMASQAGYFIGANTQKYIRKLMRSGFLILVGYFVVLVSALYFFPKPVIELFTLFNKNASDKETILQLFETLKVGLLLSCGYLFFGGIRCLVSGILSAAGDAKFLMSGGTLFIWIFLLLPSYFLILKGQNTVTVAQTLLAIYGFAAACIYFLRYRYGSWQKKSLLISETKKEFVPKD